MLSIDQTTLGNVLLLLLILIFGMDMAINAIKGRKNRL